MTDQQFTIDNVNTQLQSYLKDQARKLTHFNKPLTFKTQMKAHLKISDINRNSYEVDLSQEQTFKNIFQDKIYKNIRLQTWDFEFKFQGKTCQQIALTSQHVWLIASKQNKKQIRDCNFRAIIANQKDVAKLAKPLLGYLNRLGKRNLLSNSDNVAAEIPSLVNYIRRSVLFDPFERISISTEDAIKPQIDPLTLVNSQGRQMIQKLTHFISRQNLIHFMYEQELSEQGSRKMRRLIFPKGSADGKKLFSKNIVQALQKSIIQ